MDVFITMLSTCSFPAGVVPLTMMVISYTSALYILVMPFEFLGVYSASLTLLRANERFFQLSWLNDLLLLMLTSKLCYFFLNPLKISPGFNDQLPPSFILKNKKIIAFHYALSLTFLICIFLAGYAGLFPL